MPHKTEKKDLWLWKSELLAFMSDIHAPGGQPSYFITSIWYKTNSLSTDKLIPLSSRFF